MSGLDAILTTAFGDADLALTEIPRLELYMDQILTLLDEGLAANKRNPQDKIITKTMINNYSKERLIMPIKGKKYSREQVMQLLCILYLKQNLTLGDIKAIIAHEDGAIVYERAYEAALTLKAGLRDRLLHAVQEELAEVDLSDREQVLAASIALSASAGYLRRICEQFADQT